MRFVTVRELSRQAADVLDTLRDTAEPAVITRSGEPVAVLFPVDQEALERHLTESAPEYVSSR